ncbi:MULTISPECIES: hypothetical protein [Actinomycetes]|uniref:hypothetical protein n=1 Tax=Actinomycetes TaxID=1760 RepID=UPI0012FF9A7C|nr:MULTISPECIES: hypothetical protein [Actinomycetes]MCK9901361.1 hypothetical protein [Frankia sp. Cpl3]
MSHPAPFSFVQDPPLRGPSPTDPFPEPDELRTLLGGDLPTRGTVPTQRTGGGSL